MNWQRNPTSPRHRPTLEVLEDRTVLSTLTLSGTDTLSLLGSKFSFNGTDYPINEQAAGSLTTTQEGTISATIDTGAHTISFNSAGTAIAADISGNWQPNVGGGSGSAPADYGGTFSFLGTNLTALRGIVSGITSGALPLTRIGGPGIFSFPSTQTLTLTAGTLDYSTGLFGNGTLSVAGMNTTNTAGNGTLQADGAGNLTLAVPISASIFDDLGSGASFTVVVNGTLNATGTYPSASVIGSFQLGGAQAASQSPTGVVGNTEGLGALNGTSVAAVDTTVSSATVSDSHVVPVARVDSPAAVDAVFGDSVGNGLQLF